MEVNKNLEAEVDYLFAQLKLSLTNQTDRELGPFEVSLSQNGSYGERVVMINGLQSLVMHFVCIRFCIRLVKIMWLFSPVHGLLVS